MVSQEDKAKSRYAHAAGLIKKDGSIPLKTLQALMFVEFGVRIRTVTRYLTVMETLGLITFEGTDAWNQEVHWVEK